MSDMSLPYRPLKIAVVGTGIAGMSAAWLLSNKHDVTVYEREKRIGGHSNTVLAPGSKGLIPVDTGFIVYNERNYPNLTALFDHLGVKTKASDMSFAASLDGGRLEYSGTDLNGVFGQRANLFRPRFWTMLKDVNRFYREAPQLLDSMQLGQQSLGEYLSANDYAAPFIEDHLLPMGAAIWSASAEDMLSFPAAAFVRFFDSHGLLQVTGRPSWRTVEGGSREYVKRLTAFFLDRIQVDCGAEIIVRDNGKLLVGDQDNKCREFDHVIIATHADQALRLLVDPSRQENDLLGAIGYSTNRAVLHSDPRLMPKRKRVWSSWNYMRSGQHESDGALCVTYWMNKLQGIPDADPLFVTLNPEFEPAEEAVLQEFSYEHPQFDTAAMAAQAQLWSVQGNRNTWFCGSYFGYGFHEDALQSGLAVAEAIGGVRRPWSVEGESGRIALPPALQVAA